MENVEKTPPMGLSKKTNIAIAAMAALSASQNAVPAIVAITVIACLAIVIQGVLDWYKQAR